MASFVGNEVNEMTHTERESTDATVSPEYVAAAVGDAESEYLRVLRAAAEAVDRPIPTGPYRDFDPDPDQYVTAEEIAAETGIAPTYVRGIMTRFIRGYGLVYLSEGYMLKSVDTARYDRAIAALRDERYTFADRLRWRAGLALVKLYARLSPVARPGE